jgi:predicted ATPase
MLSAILRSAACLSPAHIEAAAKIHPYNERVFLAPYWGCHFRAGRRAQAGPAGGRGDRPSHGRKLTPGLAIRLIELPLVGIEQRADFIAERLQAG